MTDDPFTPADKIISAESERLARVQSVAAGARQRAIESGTHEAIADAVYLGAFQSAAMSLHDVDCEHCEHRTRQDRKSLSWAILCAAVAAFHPFVVSSWLDYPVYAVGFGLIGVAWAVMACAYFRRWWRS